MIKVKVEPMQKKSRNYEQKCFTISFQAFAIKRVILIKNI